MNDERAEYEELWHFATRGEQRAELLARLRADDPPPLGTSARDTYDKVEPLCRLLIAHRVLRRSVGNEEKRRAEARRFLERAQAILDELDAANAHADALCDVLGVPVGFAGALS